MRYELLKNIELKAYPEYHFYDERGECLFVISEDLSSIPKGAKGIYEAQCIIDGNFFNNGTFFVGLTVALLNNGKTDDCFFERDALCFSITDPIEETLYQTRNGYSGPFPGPLRPKFKWNVRKLRSL